MATIGKVKCGACEGVANVNEGKGGTLSIACTEANCKALTMVKSPNAVAKLRARVAAAATAASGKPAAAGDLVDELLP